mmetsp:Transcript_19442/g.23654  ORF Transcript_19442/g.23654 Transcript_19442/m.23654 type:complete len:263 (+) Transcript_19442:312-1100(+)
MCFSFLKQCLPPKVDPDIDAILNETIVSEIKYFTKLNSFRKHYGFLLLDIASGRHGKEKQEHLLLNQREAELLCGDSLQGIIECSQDLIEALRVFNTKHGRPKKQAARVLMIIGIFNDFLERINGAYFPYVRSYKKCQRMLKAKEDKIMNIDTHQSLPKRASRLNLLKNLPRTRSKNQISKEENMDYLKLWKLVSNEQFHLTGTRIDSILIMPVQRTFQTKMRFERLLKKAGDMHPRPSYYNELEKLIDELGSLAKRLNKSV